MMRCRFCRVKIIKQGVHYRAEQPGYMGLYYNCQQAVKQAWRDSTIDAAPHQPMNNLEYLEYKHEHKE